MLYILHKISEAFRNMQEKLINKKAYKIASNPIERAVYKTNYEVEFDNFIEDWVVVTGYCVNCGIQIIELVADSEVDAYFIAIKYTIKGRKPSLNEKCSNCISIEKRHILQLERKDRTMKNNIFSRVYKAITNKTENEIKNLEIALLESERTVEKIANEYNNEINSLKNELLEKDNKLKAYQLALSPSERENFERNFDVFFDEDIQKWKVVTGYCQLGGCDVRFYVADSEIDAYREAIERTLNNQRPVSNSACQECYDSFYADY